MENTNISHEPKGPRNILFAVIVVIAVFVGGWFAVAGEGDVPKPATVDRAFMQEVFNASSTMESAHTVVEANVVFAEDFRGSTFSDLNAEAFMIIGAELDARSGMPKSDSIFASMEEMVYSVDITVPEFSPETFTIVVDALQHEEDVYLRMRDLRDLMDQFVEAIAREFGGDVNDEFDADALFQEGFGISLDRIDNQWIGFNVQSLFEDAAESSGVEYEELFGELGILAIDEDELIAEYGERFIDVLFETEPLHFTTIESGPKIDDERTWRINAELNPEGMPDFFEAIGPIWADLTHDIYGDEFGDELYSEIYNEFTLTEDERREIIDVFEDVEINMHMLVGQQSNMMYGFDISSDVIVVDYEYEKPGFAFNFSVMMDEINEPVTITPPDEFIPLEELIEEVENSPAFQQVEQSQQTFAQAGNAARQANVIAISDALVRYQIDNLEWPSGIPTTPTEICSSYAFDCTGFVDLSVLEDGGYISEFPEDPNCFDACDFDSTGYTIQLESNGRITVSAPYAELGEIIEITR